MEHEDEITYEDSENWKGSSDKLSVKEIGLRIFSKAMNEGSKEMTGSGIDRKLINGQVYEIPRANQREIFVNSVEVAKIFLLPLIQKSVHKKKFDEVNSKLKKLNEEYQNKIVQTKNLCLNNSGNKPGAIDNYNKQVQEITESYEYMKVNIHKELLEAISFLLSENNYFDEVGYIGEPI